MAISFYEIMDILEMGLKPDGKSFYSNEEKAELLQELFDRGVDDAVEANNVLIRMVIKDISQVV